MCEELEVLAAKVKDGLTRCIDGGRYCCFGCPYQKYFGSCGDQINRDALTLINAAYKKKEGDENV